jgi:hypothetical protein
MAAASEILRNMFSYHHVAQCPLLPALNPFQMLLVITAVLLFGTVQALQRTCNVAELMARIPSVVRWNLYAGLVAWILVCVQFKGQDFIYFQF